MSRIKGENTAPERAVRFFLHRLGFRYRLHVSELPGKPDIVLERYRTVVFVNGCFWHHHAQCKRAALPSSRVRFWRKKIMGNVRRDQVVARRLQKLGWRVLVIWTCHLADPKRLERQLAPLLRSRRRTDR